MIDNKLIFGERLKSLRKARNLNIHELAENFSTSSSTISRYENNLMNPTRDFQLKCSKFFNCSIDYLNGLTDIKDIKPLTTTNAYETSSVDNKDLRDIGKLLTNYIDSLEAQEGFMLDGNMANEEDLELIASSIRTVIEYAKVQNKIRNTLKK